MHHSDRRQFLHGAMAAVGLVAVGGLAACSSDEETADGDGGTSGTSIDSSSTSAAPSAGSPLEEAFFAGVPLVVTMRTMQTFADLVGINRLFRTSALADASSRFVVAPNRDTIYAIAVLDLRVDPVLITMPEVADRYHVVQVLDAWMGGVTLLGTRATGGAAGTWLVVGPGYDGDVPADATRVDCPTNHAFVLGRIRAVEGDDVAEAVKVAEQIQLAGLGAGPGVDGPPTLAAPIGPPHEVGDNGAGFFDELSALLADDEPVTDAQRGALDEVADIVGAGKVPTADSPDLEPEMADVVAAGLRALDEAVGESGTLNNGWQVNLDLGKSDDSLPLRDQAVIARSFWGPVPAEEAVYPKAAVADDGQPLDGTKQYRIVLPGDSLPPVDGFWSFTVYGEDLFFAPNEIDRFSIHGDLPDLITRDDGSVEILLRHERPAEDDGANWLPVPNTPFTLVMRLYLPQAAVLDGTYEYPAIEVVAD